MEITYYILGFVGVPCSVYNVQDNSNEWMNELKIVEFQMEIKYYYHLNLYLGEKFQTFLSMNFISGKLTREEREREKEKKKTV